MDDAVLRFLIKAAVVVALILVVASYRFIRSSSPRAKKWMLASAVGLVFLVVAYGVGRSIYLKHTSPRRMEEMAAITALVHDRRAQIERVRGNLATLRDLVAGSNWLPAGDRTCPRPEEMAPLYFAFQLRGAEHAEFGESTSDLRAIEDLVSWAADPGTIEKTWWDQSPEYLVAALDRSDAPLAFVVELTEVVIPEVKDVKFARDGTVSADFNAGRVEFRLAVVEVATGEIIACGSGAAVNSLTVKVTGVLDVLESDLREQTRRAVAELAFDLIRQDR